MACAFAFAWHQAGSRQHRPRQGLEREGADIHTTDVRPPPRARLSATSSSRVVPRIRDPAHQTWHRRRAPLFGSTASVWSHCRVADLGSWFGRAPNLAPALHFVDDFCGGRHHEWLQGVQARWSPHRLQVQGPRSNLQRKDSYFKVFEHASKTSIPSQHQRPNESSDLLPSFSTRSSTTGSYTNRQISVRVPVPLWQGGSCGFKSTAL